MGMTKIDPNTGSGPKIPMYIHPDKISKKKLNPGSIRTKFRKGLSGQKKPSQYAGSIGIAGGPY